MSSRHDDPFTESDPIFVELVGAGFAASYAAARVLIAVRDDDPHWSIAAHYMAKLKAMIGRANDMKTQRAAMDAFKTLSGLLTADEHMTINRALGEQR